MRYFGTAATPRSPVFPDAVVTLMITSAPSTFNYPSGTNLVRATVCSTVGADLSAVLNPETTGAAWATSASGTAGSSVSNILIPSAGRVFQVPGTAAGGSVVGSSNAVMTLECWSRAGATG